MRIRTKSFPAGGRFTLVTSWKRFILYQSGPDEKATIVECADRPSDWFGMPASTRAYIDDSRTLPLWAAMPKTELSLHCLQRNGLHTLSCCVGADLHRHAIGRMLMTELEQHHLRWISSVTGEACRQGTLSRI